MQLTKVRVRNFRSVEDSEEFDIEHITCLVGKNESGKTAILQALAGLNPHDATPVQFGRERDYPRRYLNDYDSRHDGKDAIVVDTKWNLDDQELVQITEQFGEDCLTGHEVRIFRRYGASQPTWQLPINVKNAVQHLLSEANLSAVEKTPLKGAEDTQQLRQALNKIESRSEKQERILQRIDQFHGQSIKGAVTARLARTFPRFMYFSNYDRMAGQVQLERIKRQVDDGSLFTDEKLSGDRLFYEFLQYAGAPLDEIIATDTYETFSARLQGASNAITDQILDYWSQNPYISVEVRVNNAMRGDEPPFNEGTIGRARIYNTLHRVDVPFSERSAGFIWFFSFLVKFAQVTDGKGPIILLLDEPGLTLHGKAQGDLLRYFEEKLAPQHQVLYSTHSPFMVSPDRLTSARIVEDRVDSSGNRPKPIGTKVRSDVMETDPDTVFPLQGALGYAITQTLFVGKHTLLVEGPSDVLYLKALSSALVRHGKKGLNSKWTICPAGGIGNIRPFVSLFKGNELNVVALVDYVRGEKRKVESLREAEVLKAGAVLTAAEFCDKEEADTEDLFDAELFANIINGAYNLSGDHALTEASLMAADEATVRLVKKSEAYFCTLPPEIPEYDHYRPAEWLIENSHLLDAEEMVKETLSRAERLCHAINQLLD